MARHAVAIRNSNSQTFFEGFSDLQSSEAPNTCSSNKHGTVSSDFATSQITGGNKSNVLIVTELTISVIIYIKDIMSRGIHFH